MVYNYRNIWVSLVQILKFDLIMLDLGRPRKDPAKERLVERHIKQPSPMISYTWSFR